MNNKKDSKIGAFVILGLIGLVALVAITGCVDKGKTVDVNGSVNMTPIPQVPAEQEVTATPVPQGMSDTGISSSTSGVMERYSFDKLVSMSGSIVVAEVVNILPSRWNTQNGEKPTVSDDTSQTIYTDVNIKIAEYLKDSTGNTADNTTVTVRTLGGTVGQDKQYVEDQPLYKVNEKVLVFLKNDSDPRTRDIGNKHFVTAGSMQGKISIPTNNEVIIGDVKMSLEEVRVVIAGKGGKSYGSI